MVLKDCVDYVDCVGCVDECFVNLIGWRGDLTRERWEVSYGGREVLRVLDWNSWLLLMLVDDVFCWGAIFERLYKYVYNKKK